MKFFSWLFPKRKLTAEEIEMDALRKKIIRIDAEIELLVQEYSNEYDCCPDCAIPEYRDMIRAQERRKSRLKYLERKTQSP